MPPQPKSKLTPAKQANRLPKTIILYAESGMGKTTLAGHFPRTGWIIGSQEQGVRYLSQSRLIPKPIWVDEYGTDSVLSFDQVVKRINKAALDPSIDTLVCETLTDFQAMAFAKCCQEQFKGDMSKDKGFFAYQNGPSTAAQFIWPDLIEALNLCAGNGKDVILTAHARVKEHTDADGAKFQKYFPYAHQDIWQRAHKWASGVFLITQRTQVDNDKSTKLKKIAKDENQRILYVNATPFAAVKNWYGFDKDTIDLGDTGREGYENLMKAFERCQ